MNEAIRHLCNHLDVRQQMLLRGMLLKCRDEAGISPNAENALDYNYLAAMIAACAMDDDAELAGECAEEMRRKADTI